GTGVGNIAVAGSPTNKNSIKIEIEQAGGLNEATFRFYLNGNQSILFTVPEDGVFAIPGTGVTATFSAGSPSGAQKSFVAGDSFLFSTTAPSATNQEILDAVDTVLEAKLPYEFIVLPMATDKSLWASLAVKAEAAKENYNYTFFVCQSRYPLASETADAFALALSTTERGSVITTRVQVCSSFFIKNKTLKPIIGKYCGILSSRKPQDAPDAVKFGNIMNEESSFPSRDGHIALLDSAGYVTVREIRGLAGLYVTSGNLLSQEGSDFDVVERIRVMNRACTEVRKIQLQYLNDNLEVGADGSIPGLKIFKLVSERPLVEMTNNGEISSGEVIIPEGQNILSSKTIKTKVRIIPKGKVKFIENEISFYNPLLK
ncbi:MAG: DUF2586 family protein, partial [Clostridia bacterium]|nr:DUF2586 family protein [Clostridia bacterium]